MAMLSSGMVPPGTNPPQGLMRHFLPRRVRDGEFTLFSSCTSIPLFDWAYEACEVPYQFVIKAGDRRDIKSHLSELDVLFRMNLLSAPQDTNVFIASSPADAFRIAALLFALECNGQPMRWLVPTIGEMSHDVQSAMRGRVVAPGLDQGDALLADNVDVIEIPLRGLNGGLAEDRDVTEAFQRYRNEPGRLTIGVKSFGDATGACGPIALNGDIIDATQMRVRSGRIGEYLKLGYPTVISGSTFLGGPSPSGALLVPRNLFRSGVEHQARLLLADDLTLNWKTGVGFTRAWRTCFAGCLASWL